MSDTSQYTDAKSSSFFYVKLDTNGICIYANEAYYNRFVEYRNNFIGRSYKEIVVPEDIAKLEEGIGFCLNHPDKIFRTIIRKSSASGNPYYCYCEFWAEITEEGNIKDIACTGFEITPFKEAEKEAATYKKQIEGILDDIFEGFAVLDQDMVIMKANKSFYQYVDDSRGKDVVGRSLWDVFPEGTTRSYPQLFEKALKDKETITIDEYFEDVGKWFRSIVHPASHGLFLFFKDITEAKIAEERLNKMSQEYETVFHGTSDTLFLIEVIGPGHFVYVRNNKAHQQITGLTNEMFRGKTPQELLGKELGDTLSANYQRCVDAGQPISYEETIDLPNGTMDWYTILSPIFEGDRVAYIAGSARDITEAKKHRMQLSEYLEKFKQLSFLTSHELRHEYAKIQGIILECENLVLEKDEVKRVLDSIRGSIKNINVVISKLNDQLTFSQSPIFDGSGKVAYSKVILVDDDEVINYLNKRLLNKHCPNIKLEIFDNAKDALEYLKLNDTKGDCLIFLDLNMPRMTGWDFLDIYNTFEIQSKVIIHTSSIDIDDKLHAREYKNVMDFLSKPLTADDLNKIFDTNESSE
jgi:PAS domain S-box-containing protein